MAKRTRLIAALLAVAPLFGQAPSSTSATARVQIVSQAAWQQMQRFSAMSQIRLRGVVEQVDGAVLRLKLQFGTVQVELGQAGRLQTLRAGEALEVLAAKIMVRGSQRLLATEVLPQA